MFKKITIGLFAVMVIFIFMGGSSGAIPTLMNYQGKLTDADNVPESDLERSFVFTIYDDPSSGNNLWTETRDITTEAGFFNVILGEDTPISSSIFTNEAVYLGVNVAADGEMTPRQRIVTAGYAFNAELLGGHDSSYFATAASGGDYVLKAGDTMTGDLTIETDLYVWGTIEGGSPVKIAGGLNVQTGTATFAGSVDIGDATTDTLTITASIDSAVLPDGDLTQDMGKPGLGWNFYGDGSNLTGVATGGPYVEFAPAQVQSTSADSAIWLKVTNSSAKGVSIEATAPNAYGVYAIATQTGGISNFGGYFEAAGNTGRGVVGKASSASGVNYGVFGQSDSSTGRAVYGYASSTVATTKHGGYFWARGDKGKGVEGTADGNNAYGVHGSVSGLNSVAVLGTAGNASGTNYGGDFSAAGSAGRAVRGVASSTTGFNYAGLFETRSSDGTGLRVLNTALTTEARLATANYGGYFTGGAGNSAELASDNWAGYFEGPVNIVGSMTATSGFYGDGSNLTGVATSGDIDAYVLKAGDTMTGTLTLDGVATDITTGTDEDLIFLPNGSGVTIVGDATVEGTHSLNANDDLIVGGKLEVDGTAYLDGDTDIGNAATDTLTITASIDSDVIPDEDLANDLGKSTLRWNYIYAGTFEGDGSQLTGVATSGALDAYVLKAGDQMSGPLSVEAVTKAYLGQQSYGVKGEGGVYGVHGSATAPGGYGVYGEASGTNITYGVYGTATNAGDYANKGGSFLAAGLRGYGVEGYASNASGYNNYGGYFTSVGTSGAGVYGQGGSGAGGKTHGGYFISNAGYGVGVYGGATFSTGNSQAGGYFIAAGTGGGSKGIYAEASGTSSVNYGGYLLTKSNSGFGLVATNEASAGNKYYAQLAAPSWAGYFGGPVNITSTVSAVDGDFSGTIEVAGDVTANTYYGDGTQLTGIATIERLDNYVLKTGDTMSGRLNVYTSAVRGIDILASNSGARAIYAGATNEAGFFNYGGYFEAAGTAGQAVRGNATNTSASTSYGGYFTSAGTRGVGVYGAASKSGDYKTYGGYFTGGGYYGVGVYGLGGQGGGSAKNVGGYFVAIGGGDGAKGISAEATGSGDNYGGYFVTKSSTGMGLYATNEGTGMAASLATPSWAGYFEGPVNVTGSMTANAFYGDGSNLAGVVTPGDLSGYVKLGPSSVQATTSANAVYVETSDPSGKGVYGRATSETGANAGGYFETESPDGYGVYGVGPVTGVFAYANGASGTNYGLYGTAGGDTARVIYGYASHPSGVNYGVYGQTNSPSGYAGYFRSDDGSSSNPAIYVLGTSSFEGPVNITGTLSATDIAGYVKLGPSSVQATTSANAVYVETSDPSGKGVYGRATSETGANAGGYFETESPDGYGVYGVGPVTGVFGRAENSSGANFGLYGMAASDIGYAIYGYASHPSGVNYGVYAQTNSPSGYAGYFKSDDGLSSNPAIYVLGTSSFEGPVNIDGDLNITGVATASAYYGNGSNLTGILTSSEADDYYVNITGDTMIGDLTVEADIYATDYYGDGSNLTNVDADTLDGLDSTAFLTQEAADDLYVNITGDTMTGVLTSSVSTGTAPFEIASTTMVANLNADMVDGKHASEFLTQEAADDLYVEILGDTMTGTLTMGAGDIDLPTSTATMGAVRVNGSPFIHSYGTSNIFMGKNAGNFTMDEEGTLYNIGIGENALSSVDYGEDNVAIGYEALKANSSGYDNIAVGYQAMYSNDGGTFNTAIGTEALYLNISGQRNLAIGYDALYNTTGSYNVGIGVKAGYSTTGQGNVFIGYNSGYNETGSNKLYIENSSTSEAFALIYGEFDNDLVKINADLQVRDDTDIGDSATDTLTITASIDSDVIPNADLAHDLGKSSLRWNYIYAGTFEGDGSNLTGITAGISSADATAIFVNKTGDEMTGTLTIETSEVYAIRAVSSSLTGRAVYGFASNANSGIKYGGYFEGSGTNGHGVYAKATGTGGIGLWGNSSLSIGVYGVGSTGVKGVSSSSNGLALEGSATASGGKGVFGQATNTGTVLNYGGQFLSRGTLGYGVHVTQYATTGATYAGYFNGDSASGYGVYVKSPGIGLLATNEGSGNYAQLATGSWAGYFEGPVNVEGSMTATTLYGDGSNLTGIDTGITTADADTRYVNVTGDTMTGTLTFGNGSIEGTSTGTTLDILPSPGNYTRIGTAGTESRLTPANSDLFVSGQLEVDGTLYADTGITTNQITAGGGVSFFTGSTFFINITKHYTNSRAYFGTGLADTAAALEYDSGQTVPTLLLGLDNTSLSLLVIEKADMGENFAHSAQTNPTIFLHSADATDTTQWLSLSHDQTNAVIGVGTGEVSIEGDVAVLGDLTVVGTISGGSPVKMVGGMILQTGDLTSEADIYATYYYGDGSNLTGVATAEDLNAYVLKTGDSMNGTLSVEVNADRVFYARAIGNTGTAVYGYAGASGPYTNYGGDFIAYGDNGFGVRASAGGSSGKGVYGVAYGSDGVGVHGTATSTTGANSGGMFEVTSPAGIGLMTTNNDNGYGAVLAAGDESLVGAWAGYFFGPVNIAGDITISGVATASAFYGDGSNLSGVSDDTKVSKIGDTMTGTLTMSAGNIDIQTATSTMGVIRLISGANRLRLLYSRGTGNIFVGPEAANLNITGTYNTGIGYRALYATNSGGDNTAVGNQALQANQGGSGNVALGLHALYSNSSGYYNTGLGYQTGWSNSTGIKNVFIGYQAGYNETGSNKLYIDNSNTASPLIYGDFSTNDLTFEADVRITGDLTVVGSVTVATYYGDGSNLSGVVKFNPSSVQSTTAANAIWVSSSATNAKVISAEASGSGGRAVYGRATSNSGIPSGGYFESLTAGYGVYGQGYGTGGHFVSTHEGSGRGVQGFGKIGGEFYSNTLTPGSWGLVARDGGGGDREAWLAGTDEVAYFYNGDSGTSVTLADANYAGQFTGDVTVEGEVTATSGFTGQPYGYAELNDDSTAAATEIYFGAGSAVNTKVAGMTWSANQFNIDQTGVYECVLYANITSAGSTGEAYIKVSGTEKNTTYYYVHGSVDPVTRVITWIGTVTDAQYVTASVDSGTGVTFMIGKGSTFHVKRIY